MPRTTMNGGDPSGFGVNLIAYIRAEMGLGTAARGIAHALEAATVPFNIINFEHSNPALHRDESWKHKETLSSSYDFTLLVVNPDNLSNARTRVQKKFVKDRYTIGYWFWELPEIPDDWQASFSLVDEVWAGSRFIQDAISLRSTVPVFRVPVAISAATTNHFSRQDFSLPADKFLFLSMSDTHSHLARKNPLGTISAFKKAFRGDDKSVGLVLKLSNVNTPGADQETIELIRDEASGYGNIYLLESDMLRPEIDGLLAVSDSFVSLHRSEGFGLGPAEAMSLGKPVLLTRWSGNTDYMTPTNSIGIDYQLVPVGKQYGPYRPDQLWADPDLEQAAFWMKRLVSDPEFARKTGMLGQETIRKEFSPEAVGEVVHKRLSYLHRTGYARHANKTKANDPNAITRLQSFAPHGGITDVQHSNSAEVIPGQWCRLKLDLPWGLGDGTAQFRFDPVDRIGIVELAAVTVRASARRDILWRASTRGGLEELTVRGTALRLPHERLLRFLSYGDDPQVYLPHLTGAVFEEPLTLELLLRFDPEPNNIERAVAGWNELAVARANQAAQEEKVAQQEKTAREERAALEEEIGSLRARLDEAGKQIASATSRLANSASELEQTRQDLNLAGTNLGRVTAERDNARHELRSQSAETKLRTSQVERLGQDLKARASQIDHLAHQLSLLKKQLAVENAGKTLLMEEFTRAGEKIRSLEQDLAVLRDAAVRQRGGRMRKLLGSLVPQEKDALPDAGTHVHQSPPQYNFWIDSPTGPTPAGEKVFFAGWVLPPLEEKVLGVRALVRGETFVGQYGFERSDVADSFRDRADAAHPGFSIGMPLSVGLHEVALQALVSTGKWITFCLHQHEVIADSSLLQHVQDSGGVDSQASAGTAFQGTLENPGHETIVECGLLLITGWLYFEKGKVAEVIARVGEGTKASLAHSVPRNDVAEFLLHAPSSRDSGFEGYLPVPLGYSGYLKLTIEVVLTEGNRMVCFQRDVLVRLPAAPPPASPVVEQSDKERYARWIARNRLTPYLLKRMTRDGTQLAKTGPRISILVPTFNTPAAYLEALIDSVKKQLYPNWQLCLADDASTQPHVRAILEKAAAGDSRIAVVFREINGHIVQASNSALALAKGDYVGLLDHDDLLSADALLHVAEAVAADRSLDLLYTDEDKLSLEGKRFDPIFKGSFSPEMSLTHNYIQHFTVIRKSLLDELGGFREGFEGAQDLDLYLRVLERTSPKRVKHLPFVCYHWRSHPASTASSGTQKNYVFDSARTSIAEALDRRGIRAAPFLPDWANASNCCLYQLKWSPDLLEENPVTIVIPTKDRCELLRKCLASLEQTVNTAHVNVVIVDDFSEEEDTRNFLKELQAETRLRCRVIQPRPLSTEFNFSHLINAGVAAAETSLVLLLNNDTEARAPGWLEEMVGWMSIDGVGAVGAKLLYPDDTIQHAGVIVGSHGGLADHIFHRFPKDVIGFNFLTHAARNVSAVTAACLLTSKAAFDEVGGFDQDALGMEYNDVDFCLRLAGAGKRVVFTPQAVLLHHCAQSRGVGWRPAEHLTFLRRYAGVTEPYYNENLDLDCPVNVNPSHFGHKSRVGKLKVMMISHNLNLEGAPKVLFDHAAYFAKAGGYSVTVVSRQDGPLRKDVEEAGIAVEIVEGVLPQAGESTHAYKSRLREIGKGLDIESFDLVVCNTLTSFWGVILAEEYDLPAIWHIHESTTLDQFFYFDPVPAGLVENCLGSADRVVFEANATRQLLSRYQKRDNFETIPGSIDVSVIDRFREQHSPRSVKVKYGIDPDKIAVTLIGTTCPRKGQHVFMQAIATLKAKWPDEIGNFCFVMLGARESPYLDLLRSQMRTISDTDTRLIEESYDVFDFYCLTDIFVCASFQESFPRVILEAMAFELAIVSTDVFGIPEIIENRGEGLLVHPGDPLHIAKCIEELYRSPKNREELGAKAHAKVTRLFNSPTQLRRQLDLTKEVVAMHE